MAIGDELLIRSLNKITYVLIVINVNKEHLYAAITLL